MRMWEMRERRRKESDEKSDIYGDRGASYTTYIWTVENGNEFDGYKNVNLFCMQSHKIENELEW